MPQTSFRHTPFFIAQDSGFTPAELDALTAYADRLPFENASVFTPGGAQSVASRVRVTRRAGIGFSEETKWLFERMQALAHTINAECFEFDLRGFSEPFQYAVYDSAEGGHYNWHVDHGEAAPKRKLSFTLQLSEADAYAGGDLQFQLSDTPEAAPRKRGTVIAFPSLMLHRVAPVTAGIRKSLVAWASGPKYR